MDKVSGGSGPFVFSPERERKAQLVLCNYPQKRSAILPILHLVQEQLGWISGPAVEFVANLLGMRCVEVYEVATFYTMFNLSPVTKFHFQVCRTTPCWLRGCEKVLAICKLRAQKRSDLFTVSEVECLGACVDAPVVQVNNDYYENLDEQSLNALFDGLEAEGDGK